MKFNGDQLPNDIVSDGLPVEMDTVRDLSTEVSELLQIAALAKVMELAIALGGYGKERELLRVVLFLICEQFTHIASADMSEQLSSVKSALK